MEIELIESSEQEIVIKLSGRMDSSNAEESFQQLHSIREENRNGKLSLDLSELTYISSAGLRVLLKLQKEETEKIRLFGVSIEVYEIFEMTGFVKMLDVQKRIRNISIEGCEKIGQGANGAVYRIDADTIIKVFLPTENLETINRERIRAQQAFTRGIPTAISYDVVKCNDSYGIVFELLNAESLSTAIKDHPENFDEYAEKYVRVLKDIHQVQVEDGEFQSIKKIYYDAIEECRSYYTQEELDKLIALVDSVPERKTLIHGDYHAHNIMLQDNELTLIDMGDLSYGHPIFEFLATAATQVNLVKLNPAFAEIHTGMPVEMITKLWKRLMEYYFSDKTTEEIARIDEQICNFSKLKVALAPAFGKGAGEEVILGSVADAKANLLPIIDKLIGSVDW